jgi:hypothetical protein
MADMKAQSCHAKMLTSSPALRPRAEIIAALRHVDVSPKPGDKDGIHGRSRRKNIGNSKAFFISL